jgi:hypothetical protein
MPASSPSRQYISVPFDWLCTGDLFVTLDVSNNECAQVNDLRICFYIFFGLTSVVSSLSLISKRAV